MTILPNQHQQSQLNGLALIQLFPQLFISDNHLKQFLCLCLFPSKRLGNPSHLMHENAETYDGWHLHFPCHQFFLASETKCHYFLSVLYKFYPIGILSMLVKHLLNCICQITSTSILWLQIIINQGGFDRI